MGSSEMPETYPDIMVPLVIIHFRWGFVSFVKFINHPNHPFSMGIFSTNPPILGVPPAMKPRFQVKLRQVAAKTDVEGRAGALWSELKLQSLHLDVGTGAPDGWWLVGGVVPNIYIKS